MTAAWLALPALIILCVIASEYRRRALRRIRTHRAISVWQDAPIDQRATALEGLIATDYRAAAAWYLLGSLYARRRDFGMAARLFGMAHHVDADLTSAAVLTFACLKAAGRPEADHQAATQALRQTWGEMRKPIVGYSALEQAVLRAIMPDDQADLNRAPLDRLAGVFSDLPV